MQTPGTVSEFLVKISFESPGAENTLERRFLADVKIAKDLSLDVMLCVGHLSAKMQLESQELVATKTHMEAGRVPRDIFRY